MERFGDLAGIVFNSLTGELVCGHQRVEQLRRQYGDIEIERLGETHGVIKTKGGEFSVRFVSWSEAQQRAANVAANSPKLQGKFDETLTEFLMAVADEVQEEVPGAMDDLRLLELLTIQSDAELQQEEIKPKYEVVVNCESEDQQAEVFEFLSNGGYTNIRILTQ